MPETQELTLAEKIDLIAEGLYPSPKKGFYFEAGANDGVSQSNSLTLEQMGWRGILVEPSPAAYELLVVNRPQATCTNTALVADPSTKSVTGTFSNGSLLGSIDPVIQQRDRTERFKLPSFLHRLYRFAWVQKITSRITLAEVPAQTLQGLLANIGSPSIDLFFLDVEGYELEVLKGFDFSPKPRILIIETRTEECQAIAEILLEQGYICVSNLSGFTHDKNPLWQGDHQDFAWCQANDFDAITLLSSL